MSRQGAQQKDGLAAKRGNLLGQGDQHILLEHSKSRYPLAPILYAPGHMGKWTSTSRMVADTPRRLTTFRSHMLYIDCQELQPLPMPHTQMLSLSIS